MSTKTTFKRIALATVATLGFGILSVFPSHAAGMLADTLLNAADGTSVVASTATVGSGSAATAKIVYSAVATSGSDSATITGSITSVPATSGAYAVSFAATSGTLPNSTSPVGAISGNTISTNGAGRVTKYITASFTPDVAGTYVIAIKTAGGINNQTVTWTITVAGVPAATAAASEIHFSTDANQLDISGNLNYLYYTANQQGTETLTAAFATTADATADASGSFSIPVTAGTAGTVVGSGLITFSNKTAIAANTAVAVPVTASISAHGYVKVVNFATSSTSFGTSVTETADNGNTAFGAYGKVKGIQVISDGTTGPATITITAGGVTLGTVDLIFTGAKASLALATGSTTKLSKNYIGLGDTATVTIQAKDAAGNILASSGITAVTSSDATGSFASAIINGDKVIVTGGAVSGKVTWTVTDADKKNSVTFVTNTVKKTGTFVTSFDAASYGPGEKVTWKIVGTDSNGSPVADGARAVFASVDANMSVAYLGVGSLPTTSPTFVDGVATGYFYAPAASAGTFNLSTTIGAADSTYATASAAALAAKTVSSFTISNAPVDAATDAANQAYDAANAATDAALAAADAADAATSAAQDASDAVAALSATVAKLVASLKAQITSLTNLVIKIQKKVKA